MKIVKTIGIINLVKPYPKEFIVGLGYCGTLWWATDKKIYLLNVALGDMAVLCKNANEQRFIWGNANEMFSQYKINNVGSPIFCKNINQSVNPKDYLPYAVPIINKTAFDKSLDEKQTFYSRGLNRKISYGFPCKTKLMGYNI